MGYSEQFIQLCAEQDVGLSAYTLGKLTIAEYPNIPPDHHDFASPFRRAIDAVYKQAMFYRRATILERPIDVDRFPDDPNLRVLARLANASLLDPHQTGLEPLVPKAKHGSQACHRAEKGWTAVNRMLVAYNTDEPLPNNAGVEIYVDSDGRPLAARKAIDYATAVLMQDVVIGAPEQAEPEPPVLYPPGSLVQLEATGDERALQKVDQGGMHLELDAPVVVRSVAEITGLTYGRPLALAFPPKIREEHFGTKPFVAACPTMEELQYNIATAASRAM